MFFSSQPISWRITEETKPKTTKANIHAEHRNTTTQNKHTQKTKVGFVRLVWPAACKWRRPYSPAPRAHMEQSCWVRWCLTVVMKLICTDLQAHVPCGVLYLFAYLVTSVWKVWTLVMVSPRIDRSILADWSQNHHVLWGVNQMEPSCTWLNVWNCRYVNSQYFSQN